MMALPLEGVLSENVANIGRRIRAIRVGKGWSQGELAERLGRSQTAISYWEAGRRELGVDDLVELAEVLGVSTADLLPTGRRRRPVAALLRAVAEEVDEHRLADQLEGFVTAAEKLDQPTQCWDLNVSSPRNTAESLVAEAAIIKPPIPVVQLAHGCGVRVLSWVFENVDGLLVKLDDGPVIGVNSQQAESRQRFSIAHELGHHLLQHAERFHVDFGDDLSPRAAGGHPTYDWREERAANEFAANLLMPATLVRAEFKWNTDVKALASRFDVSPAAMGYRIKNLGLV